MISILSKGFGNSPFGDNCRVNLAKIVDFIGVCLISLGNQLFFDVNDGDVQSSQLIKDDGGSNSSHVQDSR